MSPLNNSNNNNNNNLLCARVSAGHCIVTKSIHVMSSPAVCYNNTDIYITF